MVALRLLRGEVVDRGGSGVRDEHAEWFFGSGFQEVAVAGHVQGFEDEGDAGWSLR